MLMLITKKTFSSYSFPLKSGVFLIESSAGTGKTDTLSTIYLRLLIGNFDKNNFYKNNVEIEKILVVTFTEEATKNLRFRIRKKISDFREACIRGYSDNFFFLRYYQELII